MGSINMKTPQHCRTCNPVKAPLIAVLVIGAFSFSNHQQGVFHALDISDPGLDRHRPCISWGIVGMGDRSAAVPEDRVRPARRPCPLQRHAVRVAVL